MHFRSLSKGKVEKSARAMRVQGAFGTREAGRDVLEASACEKVLLQESADVRM